MHLLIIIQISWEVLIVQVKAQILPITTLYIKL